MKIEITYNPESDVYYDLTVTDIDYRGGKPAKLHALPEDCYPAEAPELISYRVVKIIRHFDDSAWTAEGYNLELPSEIDEDDVADLIIDSYITARDADYCEDMKPRRMR